MHLAVKYSKKLQSFYPPKISATCRPEPQYTPDESDLTDNV